MGYIAHDALIIVAHGHAFDEEWAARHAAEGYTIPDVAAFRETLPKQFRQLLIGPVTTAANSDAVVAFLPDGSKEGWGTSDEGDRIRADLAAMFAWCYSDGSSPFRLAEAHFGADDRDYGDPDTIRDPREPRRADHR